VLRVGLQLEPDEATRILVALELTGFQLKALAEDIGDHDRRLGTISEQIEVIKTALALAAQSKSRIDLAIESLPQTTQRVDRLWETLQRMQNNMDSIRNQAWAGFTSAIAVSLVGWGVLAWQGQRSTKTGEVWPVPVALKPAIESRST
jgi:hypothetical protein